MRYVITGSSISELLLCAAAGNLARSKNQRDWTPLNAVLIPTLLTEATILDGEISTEDLLKIFLRCITERAEEEEYNVDDYDKYIEDEEEEE